MMDHLNALELRLSNERNRLSQASTDTERKLRSVYVAQAQKEIAAELEFLGLEPLQVTDLNDDDLLAELNSQN